MWSSGENSIASLSSNCSPSRQAAVYGKCIVADYNDIHKNKCGAEFAKFQECVKAALKK